MNPLKRQVTAGLCAVALVAAACGGGSTAGGGSQHAPARGFTSAHQVGATSHVYEGTIQGNPSISLNCAGANNGGPYVQRDPSTGPNIFDHAHIDNSSDSNVSLLDVAPGGGVDWGHWGSLLATQISGNIGPSGDGYQGKHYKITLYCTSSQDDAWVIIDAAATAAGEEP
jgi:hypothetical protein